MTQTIASLPGPTSVNPVQAAITRSRTEEVETFDIVATSGVHETACTGDGLGWRIEADKGLRVYLTDADLATRLRGYLTPEAHHRVGVPICHLRVKGIRFIDHTGRRSLIVTDLVEAEYLGKTRLCSATIEALAAAKPTGLADALLIVAKATASVHTECTLSRSEARLTFCKDGITYRLKGDPSWGVVWMSVLETVDGEAVEMDEVCFDTLGNIEHDLMFRLQD